MSYTRLLFIELLLIILVASCRKDEPYKPDPDAPYCECCHSNTTPLISAGNSSQMYVRQINASLYLPIINTDEVYDTIGLDLENDLEVDFRIIGHKYWDGYVLRHTMHIESANDNSFVSAMINADTIYTYTTTSSSGSNPVTTTITSFKSCHPLTCCDPVYSINHKPRFYSYNDNIMLYQSWVQKCNLYQLGYSCIGEVYDMGENVWVYSYVWDPSCANIPSDTTYVGIKKTNCDVEKLGWIKMYGSKVIETAIHR